jgi:Mg/Co/Ni transporter MgtE
MHLVGRLKLEHGAQVLDAVTPEVAAGALSAGRPDVAARLLHELEPSRAAEILARMPIDDAAAALRELEDDDAGSLLRSLERPRAARIRALLEHAEGTAGAVMTPDARTARVGESLEEVRERVSANPPTLDGLLTVVLIDEAGRPHGVLTATTVISGRGKPVPVPAVPAHAPLDRVLELFATYDVLAVPVVDAAGTLAGVVGVDDILDVLLAERRPGRRRYRIMGARRRAPA